MDGADQEGSAGRKLREARGKRGVELAEVEASTKIRARFLAAIEEEDWEALPSGFYARSFIRTYAGYLGLDAAELLDSFERSPARSRAERAPEDEPPEAAGPADPARPAARPEPTAPTLTRAPRRHRRRPSRLVAGGLALAAIAAAAVVWVSDQGGESGKRHPARGSGEDQARRSHDGGQAGPRPARRGATVSLTATDEVWVCLLDHGGSPLVDGEILTAGAEAGPFTSGGFTLSLGNAAVEMSVDGKPAAIPQTSGPIGLAIDGDGRLRQLDEGDRPTCT